MVNKIKLMAVVIAIMLLGLPIGILHIINFQNAKSIATSQSIPVRVACVGDSITQTSGYTSDLQSLLGPKYSVGNFGVTGSTVSLDSYKPYLKQPEFAAAQDFAPDIVVVMLGTNDAHYDLQQNSDSFEDNYMRLTGSFENLSSSPQILVVKSPPVYDNNLGINPTFFSDNIIPHIQDVANQQNLLIVDVYDAFGNHSDYTVDGIHPNDNGAALIASEVYNAITPDSYVASSFSG